ncbi:Endonuclease V [invertebrate metagenome]|uniref:Endonuclease V n=1 Tax=invertebrate metagenome TaxID=1711999 RepID=A0A2H9TAW6_9ZZZZ
MNPISHSWHLSPKEAIALQKTLAPRVCPEDHLETVKTVAGVDVGFEQQGSITRAAIAILNYPSLELIDFSISRSATIMPYIPGILSFRECPAILQALEKITQRPDLLICDGQGIAHPRRFGLACHLGLLTGIPSVGVAKNRLCGTHLPLSNKKGASVPLTDNGEIIGQVYRSRSAVKPLYVSIGHNISLATAIHYVQTCLIRYRLPETTRWADALASNRGKALEKARATLGREIPE